MIDLGAILHQVVDLLLLPVVATLLVLTMLTMLDVGVAIGERLGGIGKLRAAGTDAIARTARARIMRADLAMRVGPSLGLMGTLIPLGPGIAAMGRGDFQTLSEAIATAFDTTVLGLLIGLVGYLIGRWRRIAYDRAMAELETGHA